MRRPCMIQAYICSVNHAGPFSSRFSAAVLQQPFFCNCFFAAGLSSSPLFLLSPAGLHKAFKYIGGHSICLPHILRMPLKGQKIGIIRHLQGLDDAVGRMAAGNEAGGNPAYGLMMGTVYFDLRFPISNPAQQCIPLYIHMV